MPFEPMDAYGLISFDEGQLLTRLAALEIPGCIVEFGSFLGRSTLFLDRGSNGKTIYTLDIGQAWDWIPPSHKNYRSPDGSIRLLMENLVRGARGKIRVITESSQTVAVPFWEEESIGLLHHDGAHQRHMVEQDIEKYRPYMSPGGLMVFHDFENPGHEGVKEGIESAIPDWQDRIYDRVDYMLALKT